LRPDAKATKGGMWPPTGANPVSAPVDALVRDFGGNAAVPFDQRADQSGLTANSCGVRQGQRLATGCTPAACSRAITPMAAPSTDANVRTLASATFRLRNSIRWRNHAPNSWFSTATIEEAYVRPIAWRGSGAWRFGAAEPSPRDRDGEWPSYSTNATVEGHPARPRGISPPDQHRQRSPRPPAST
jgi:hypothetical protein